MIGEIGGKLGRGIRPGFRQRADDVRRVRKLGAHEEDAVPEPMSVDEARAQFHAERHELPDEWG